MLQKGVGFVNITPWWPVDLYGFYTFGLPTRVSMGVRSELFVKAMVLDDGTTEVAMITIDGCEIDDGIIAPSENLIKEKAGIDHCFIAASHTHYAPAMAQNHGLGKVDERFYASLPPAILKAVQMAKRNKNPVASVKSGSVAVRGLFFNRSFKKLADDAQLIVLQLDETTLWSVGCHPVCGCRNRSLDGKMNFPDTRISADYPGDVERLYKLYNRAPGTDFLFLQGASGDINPVERYDQTGKTEEMSLCLLHYLEEASRKAERISEPRLWFRQAPVELDVVMFTANEIVKLADEQMEQNRKEDKPLWVSHWEEWRDGMLVKLARGEFSPIRTTTVSFLAVGNVGIGGTGAELYSSLEGEVQFRSPFPYTRVASNVGALIGYVSDDTPGDDRKYYSDILSKANELEMPFKAGVNRKLVDALVGLAEEAGEAMGVKKS